MTTEDGFKKRVLVIGGGPGGYTAAIRAAQLGCSVTLAERDKVGGTCLNVGCVPTKALLHEAGILRSVASMSANGTVSGSISVDMQNLQKYKNSIVAKLRRGVEALLRSNGIRLIKGSASFISGDTALISSNEETERIGADAFIVATGASPVLPQIDGIGFENIHTSDGALAFDFIPKSIFILGAGAVGMEFASFFSGIGAKTTVAEMAPNILPGIDAEITDILAHSMTSQGVDLLVGASVAKFSESASGVTVSLDTKDGASAIEVERVLVCAGRRPDIAGLNLGAAGVSVVKGKIWSDSFMRTSNPIIYAIGDCTSPIMLAHVAEREGEIAASNIMGNSLEMTYGTCPAAVYTIPEIGSVGLSENDARKEGIDIQVGRFPLAANAKSLINGYANGLIKVTVGKKYGEILGAQMIGPNVTDLLGETVLAIDMEVTVDEMKNAVHPHPSVCEALREAVMDAAGEAISLPKRG
jgi:dihydrolipoamide dehydrogenase